VRGTGSCRARLPSSSPMPPREARPPTLPVPINDGSVDPVRSTPILDSQRCIASPTAVKVASLTAARVADLNTLGPLTSLSRSSLPPTQRLQRLRCRRHPHSLPPCPYPARRRGPGHGARQSRRPPANIKYGFQEAIEMFAVSLCFKI
jgi:hypothetical protein